RAFPIATRGIRSQLASPRPPAARNNMARSKSKNVGVIGLGIIGSRVAGAMRNKGLQVFVWNRTPRPEQNFVGSPAEVAELCDLVQIFVADDEALLEMVRQLSPGLTAQHIITAHCTVAPESMRAAAELAQRRGARFLEAPFTGSKVAAEKGQLVYYISGDDAALKQARPILESSSKDIIFIGDKIGDASIMKVATNIVTAATAQIAAEALAIVRKAGIPAELFSRAMKSNASNSATIEMKVPLMIAGDFETHFSVKHMLKDVRIGMKLAENYALDLPVTDVSGDMLLAEMKQGRGDADYSSVAQKYFPAPTKVAEPEAEKLVELIKPPTPSYGPKGTEGTKPAEPLPEAKPVVTATSADGGKEEEKEEEIVDGENLSGGFRGWFSKRRFSSPRES
ncbi:MAG: NAD(P)-dependent oxidoreductase, partial [Verrucomicrobiota bacterium]|nr:NAD(P)-dependent oxidoreductase [Verrucomicrobiota bacterium]